MFNKRHRLAKDLAHLATRHRLSGFTLDWEFGHSFDWLAFNQTWSYVAGELAKASCCTLQARTTPSLEENSI